MERRRGLNGAIHMQANEDMSPITPTLSDQRGGSSANHMHDENLVTHIPR